MATWHQRRAGGVKPHHTLWSLVSDPPNECTAVTRFASKEDAEEYLEKLKAKGKTDYCYILPPHPQFRVEVVSKGDYTILLNDRVQPFGAIFYGERSDRKDLVLRAIKTLNIALAKKATSCIVSGYRRDYTVQWDDKCFTGEKQVTIV